MISLSPIEGYTKIKRIAGVAISVGDEVLLIQRAADEAWSPHKWALPAGGVDEGEGYANAASREVSEETGVACPPERLREVATFYHVSPDVSDLLLEFHLFEYCADTKPSVSLNYELQNAVWIRRSHIPNYDLLDGEDFVLATYFDRLTK